MQSIIALGIIFISSLSMPSLLRTPDSQRGTCSNFTEIGPTQINRYIRYKVDYDSLEARSYQEEKTGEYFAIVISYSSIKYSLIQARHLIDLGYSSAGILKIDDRFAVYIQKGESQFDDELITDTGRWMQECGESQVYIRKY